MNLRQIDFPYPILRKDSLDYINCSINFKLYEDQITFQDSNIVIVLEYDISCPSIEDLIKNGQAKAIAVAESSFASFRKVYDFNQNKKLNIDIDKDKVIKNIKLMFQIVANDDLPNFSFPEHNKEFFGNQAFSLKKGDIIALGEDIVIRLDASELEKPLSSVIKIKKNPDIKDLYVSYEQDNIYLSLYTNTYDKYYDSRRYNNGVFETVLKSILCLPIITKAVNDVRAYHEDPETYEYNLELTWVKSIINRAQKLGIDFLEEQDSFITANKILGNLLEKSIDSLYNIIKKIINGNEIIEEGGND